MTTRALATLALAPFLTTATLADVNNQARAIVQPDFTPSSGPVDNIVQHPGACASSGTAFGGFSSLGDSDCQVNYGYISIDADAQGSLNATGMGTSRDTLLFTAPGITNGTAGEFTFTINVHSALAANSGASGASWSAHVNVNGNASSIGRSGAFYSPTLHNPQYVGDPLGSFTGTGSFQFGHPAQLTIDLSGTADAANNSSGSGQAAVSGLTLTWGGISAVTHNGQPVSNWSLTSGSTTNWQSPITPPCPADLGSQGGVAGSDGSLDNNDFIVFISDFFASNPAADLGSQGGVVGADGHFDNNDFIAFISLFFAGC